MVTILSFYSFAYFGTRMFTWKLILFGSLSLVFYNYIGYAIIAHFLNKISGNQYKPLLVEDSELPSITFIVAAYNEESCMLEKINNSLHLHYPQEKIEYLFVTDGSTDATNSIIANYPQIRLLFTPERKGKSAALNRAIASASHDILIFSDANTFLNDLAIKNIARHYTDERTGGVAGEKKIMHSQDDGALEGEGIYWKYESALKKIDATFYSVVGAAGELFSVRKKLYEPLPHNIILDDFVISLRIAQKGYRIGYEPDAYAMETASLSIAEEQKRKIRIAAGGFQSIALLKGLLKWWKQPRLSFLYISHRVLRWAVSPFCLLLLLLANIVVVANGSSWFYNLLLAAQGAFYLVAALVYLFPQTASIKLFKISYYFAFMNVSVYLGFWRYLRGNQSAVWAKAKRK